VLFCYPNLLIHVMLWWSLTLLTSFVAMLVSCIVEFDAFLCKTKTNLWVNCLYDLLGGFHLNFSWKVVTIYICVCVCVLQWGCNPCMGFLFSFQLLLKLSYYSGFFYVCMKSWLMFWVMVNCTRIGIMWWLVFSLPLALWNQYHAYKFFDCCCMLQENA